MFVEVKVTGTLPLICHSQRAMNLRDPDARLLKKLGRGKDKTDEQLEQISDLEFKFSLYLDKQNYCCMPYLTLKRSIQDGAKKSKKGPLVVEALRPHPECDMFPILVNGKKVHLNDIAEDPEFRDVRTVVVDKKVITRTRAIFRDYEVRGLFNLKTETLNLNDLESYAKDAGERVGWGDYRVGKNGEYGLYVATVRAL